MRYPIFLFVLSIACNKEIDPPDQSGFIAYTIPKGGHYALQSSVKPFNGNVLSYTVRFDSSAIYYTSDPKNQADVNKVFGFSDNNHHHETSARFGWNWDGRQLQLYAYCYSAGVRSVLPLESVDINREYLCSIKVLSDRYEFSLSGSKFYISRSSSSLQATGYHLYPYFGGDETAPHEITIFLREE